jgi:hypothetical protein
VLLSFVGFLEQVVLVHTLIIFPSYYQWILFEFQLATSNLYFKCFTFGLGTGAMVKRSPMPAHGCGSGLW